MAFPSGNSALGSSFKYGISSVVRHAAKGRTTIRGMPPKNTGTTSLLLKRETPRDDFVAIYAERFHSLRRLSPAGARVAVKSPKEARVQQHHGVAAA